MQHDSDEQLVEAGATAGRAAKRAEVARARFHVAAQKGAALAAGGRPSEAEAARMVAEFHARGGRIALLHTGVPEALPGQGVGSKLVRGVLDRIRAEGARVVPRWEFVAAHIERHPEYRDLLADEG